MHPNKQPISPWIKVGITFYFWALTSLLLAQTGPVIPKAASLAWDNPNTAGVVQQSKMYCDRAPNITQDPIQLVATIDAPTYEWPITLDPGQWYCAVSFTDGTVESELSNEIAFYILDPPSNPRIVR